MKSPKKTWWVSGKWRGERRSIRRKKEPKDCLDHGNGWGVSVGLPSQKSERREPCKREEVLYFNEKSDNKGGGGGGVRVIKEEGTARVEILKQKRCKFR